LQGSISSGFVPKDDHPVQVSQVSISGSPQLAVQSDENYSYCAHLNAPRL
jgi:hypothetical protein